MKITSSTNITSTSGVTLISLMPSSSSHFALAAMCVPSVSSRVRELRRSLGGCRQEIRRYVRVLGGELLRFAHHGRVLPLELRYDDARQEVRVGEASLEQALHPVEAHE